MILILNLKHYLTHFDDILRNIHVMKHKLQFTIKTNLDHKERDYITIYFTIFTHRMKIYNDHFIFWL